MVPEVILNGRNIIKLQVGITKFIDNLNYLPMKLSALPKTFGLAGQLKKGYFPHIFNTPENENYIGPYPDRTYFTPELMGVEERVDFLKWYEEVHDKQFNLRKEITRILRTGCKCT